MTVRPRDTGSRGAQLPAGRSRRTRPPMRKQHLGQWRSCLGQASEGADVPYEGGNYYPRGVPFHLFLMCIAASSSSSDGGSTAITGTGVERDHLFPPTPNQLGP